MNAGGQLVVSYRVTSAPGNSNYGTAGIYVEFFKADPSGEGEKFLGFTHYTEADYNGGSPVVKQFNLGAVAALGISPEDPITATASDAAGNTSEFSPPFSSRKLVVTKTGDTNDDTCDADCSLREALSDANAGDSIEFASPLFDAARIITLNGTELAVNKSVTIKGKGAHLLTVSGNNQSRVFNITDGALAEIDGLTITKGNALGNFIGGGILNAGTLTLVDCHVTDNVADRGAGIYNTETLTVRACTVSGNTANGSATPAGAGIQNEGGGALEVINSTVSGNSATVSDGGGGIYVADGTATLTLSTVAANSAPQGASNAGGIKNKDGVVILRGSIVALNTVASPDLAGAFASAGFNLVGKNDGATASFPVANPSGGPNANQDVVGTSAAPVDPRLDPLGNYGGTTPTHRLQADSPAIDKGRAFGETTDQRGLSRPSDDPSTPDAAGGDASDAGAFETQFAPPAVADLGGRVTFDGEPLGGVSVVVPAGTLLPARSHFLVAHADGYTLGAYALPDLSYDGFDLPADAGITLLDAAGSVSDAVGFGNAPPPYREGSALAAVSAPAQHAFVRKLTTGQPLDGGDNQADFLLVAPDPAAVGGSALGAPGPENLSSPVARNATIKASFIDTGCAATSTGAGGASLTTCPRHRNLTADAANNSAFGTLSIRRKFTNSTGASVTRLRFRIVDVTTLNSPGYAPGGAQADLRARTSSDYAAVCVGSGGCSTGTPVTVRGTTLEELTPATPSQPAGGGINSTLSAGTVTLATPLAAGNSINVQFLLGVRQTGSFRFLINVEALPGAGPSAPRNFAPPETKGVKRDGAGK